MEFSNILIIKLGALGDFVQATTAFQVISTRFPQAKLTLLTTQPYEEFGKKLGIFENILLDPRLKFYQIKSMWRFIRNLQHHQFDCVIDLQGVDRTHFYRQFFKCAWYGADEAEKKLHPQKRFASFLKKLGIENIPPLDLANLGVPFSAPIQKPYVLVIPTTSNAHGGAKCLPQKMYAELCKELYQHNLTPIIIAGNKQDVSELQGLCPFAINLGGQTTFYHIIDLAKNAAFAIGNDTGPMLLAASGGCPTITFYSDHNPPTIGGPLGANHTSIHVPNLKSLSLDETLHHVRQTKVWSKI